GEGPDITCPQAKGAVWSPTGENGARQHRAPSQPLRTRASVLGVLADVVDVDDLAVDDCSPGCRITRRWSRIPPMHGLHFRRGHIVVGRGGLQLTVESEGSPKGRLAHPRPA